MNQPHKPKKLLDQLSDQIRLKQYSPRTEKTYLQWVHQYNRYPSNLPPET